MRESLWIYCASKKWYWYTLLFIFALYLFIDILGFQHGSNQPFVVSSLYIVLFGIHEVAHLATAFFPSIITAAAGSSAEILFTSTVFLIALRAKAYFAAIFASLWVALAFRSAGLYMADARSQSMDLVGFGETVIHDWHYVFSQLHILTADAAIGFIVQAIGIIAGIGGLCGGIALIITMFIAKNKSGQITMPVQPQLQIYDAEAAIEAARQKELTIKNTPHS